MQWKRGFAACFFVMATVPARAQTAAPAEIPAAPPALSLSDAFLLAQNNSATLAGAQARLEASQARLRAAGNLSGLNLALAHAFGKNTGGFDEDVILSQTFELGKRGARSRAARGENEAARFERTGSQTELFFTVQSAYYEALRAQTERDLAQTSLESAQTFATAAKNQLEAGDAPRANVVRSQIEVARATQALDAAQTERANRFATLASLLQTPVETLQLSDALAFEPTHFDLETLQNLALSQRADVRAARALQIARQAAISSARAQNRPDAFVEARRAALVPYHDQTNGQSLRIGLTLPLFDFGSRKAALQEAGAAAREQNATVQETERTARLEVATALANLETAARAVNSFQKGRLAQSKELLEMAQIGYEHGANSYLELLDAQNVFRSEAADYNRAMADWNFARATLQRAVGGQLP